MGLKSNTKKWSHYGRPWLALGVCSLHILDTLELTLPNHSYYKFVNFVMIISDMQVICEGPVDFASKIIGIIGIQKQQAKCWHNRSTVKQRSSKIKQNRPTDSISSLTLHRHLKQTQHLLLQKCLHDVFNLGFCL